MIIKKRKTYTSGPLETNQYKKETKQYIPNIINWNHWKGSYINWTGIITHTTNMTMLYHHLNYSETMRSELLYNKISMKFICL